MSAADQYQTLAEYLRRADVFVLRAEDIRPEERTCVVPDECGECGRPK